MTWHPEEPTPELSTTGTGGRSARLIAFAVVAVLAIVVFIGVSQRQPAPSVPPDQPNVAVVPSPAPSQTTPVTVSQPAETAPSAYPGAEPITARRGPAPSYGDVSVSLEVGGKTATVPLTEVAFAHLHAAYRVPLPAPEAKATLEVMERRPDARPTQYGSWTVPLDLAPAGQNVDVDISAYAPTVLLAADRVPDPAPPQNASLVLRNGYRIQVTAARIGDSATVNVDIVLGDDPTFPAEKYDVIADVGGRQFQTAAATGVVAPGGERGEIQLPTSLRARMVTVRLSAASIDASQSVRVVGSYTLALPRSQKYEGPWLVASPVATHGPDTTIESSGYVLTVRFSFANNKRTLSWELRVNPTFAPRE